MKTVAFEIMAGGGSPLPQKFKHLRELAGAINSRQEEIDAQKNQLNTVGNALGCNLRLQGLDLLRAKKDIEHGLWLDWLASHCPNTDARLASLCMNLANRQHVADLDQCDTWAELRGLMAVAKSPAKAEPRPWPVAPNLRNLQILVRWSGTIKNAPLEVCPKSILERYRTILEPLARVLWPDRFPAEGK